MASTIVSHMTMPACLRPGPLEMAPFVADNSNLFPKMVEHINETAWELWYFDGVTADASTAITISFFRDARSYKQGFRTQVNAIWPDGTKWGDELYFSDTAITESDGELKGIWRSDGADMDKQASFVIAPDKSTATLSFDVPGCVRGRVQLTALPPSSTTLSNTEAMLGPSVHWMRPVPTARVTADLTFLTTEKDSQNSISRGLQITAENNASGGMDRFWTSLSWPQLMTESYFLRGNAGPYTVHLMRIISSAAAGQEPFASARLYHDGKLVCTTDVAGASDGPYVVVEKQYKEAEDTVTGAFRDRNTGYTVDFFGPAGEAKRKHWRFDVIHARAWWNMPTSAPGPNATGNSGFLERMVGGLVEAEEEFKGWAGAGQAELQ